MAEEWYAVLIFPVACIFFVYIIGKRIDLWHKLQIFLNKRGGSGHRVNFHSVASGLKGMKNVRFEGVAKFFRKD